ncbi:hypothetical protein EV207_11644 [Scopulibacillus darangshiensis]|uniref:Uncharacterized protein n=1 Tax=Scopulibacillus darangshiensis TaxID=442528 RepID=A0A4R2P289_9BACL|nr:hypothetical protein [Scopulibacillus darangshiensis]TCP28732.1 hypothetical protein EV207_11644 [Scopulibacillus darangshiensis]
MKNISQEGQDKAKIIPYKSLPKSVQFKSMKQIIEENRSKRADMIKKLNKKWMNNKS